MAVPKGVDRIPDDSSAVVRSLSRLSPSQQEQQQQLVDAGDGQGFIDFKGWPSGGLPRLRSQTSFRTRLRQARKDVGGPVSLFEWETRGHFWSALDKAADPSQARGGTGSWLRRWRQEATVRTKNTFYVVALRPGVLLWPLLLLGACIGLGLAGVMLGSRDEADKSRDEGSSLAAHTASSLAVALGAALGPLRQLELLAGLRPAMAELGPAFGRVAPRLAGQAPAGPASLALAPCGVVRAVYERPGSAGAGAAADPAAAAAPALGSHAVASGVALTISQLQTLRFQSAPAGSPSSSSSASPALAALGPVLISGVGAEETWGNGAPANASATAGGGGDTCGDNGNCSACAWDARDGGTKLWGFVAATLDLTQLADQSAAGLSRLEEIGYSYRLRVRSDPDPSAQVLAELTSGPQAAAALGGGGGDAAAVVAVPAESGSWELAVRKEGGWHPEWRDPLEAVVVVLSAALAAMLFMALVIRQRQRMLLGAMLPDKVVRAISSGRPFYEHFDVVTVLYADIVRYSNATTGTPPWEVVKLLNDVNNIFDTLLEKHGLVKIRRSGEAFMGVGGCPESGDPISTAVRVALCAREMVMEVARYRSAAGQRVQIRLGLHSGPVVAAVVGSAQPRFSLFGDTIDIAHFMESTSTIMGVHVSDTTAELLDTADDPLIMLQPRGIIDIRGRGPITTYWLRIDLLAPMGTFGDRASTNLHKLGTAGGGGTSTNLGGGGGGGGGAAAGGGGDGRRGAPAATPAEVACTADLAVAATLGMRGAPLVRKLSQTGLARTLRALPGRGQRVDLEALYDKSVFGSFSARLEPETLDMVQKMLAAGVGGRAGGGSEEESAGSGAEGPRAVEAAPACVEEVLEGDPGAAERADRQGVEVDRRAGIARAAELEIEAA